MKGEKAKQEKGFLDVLKLYWPWITTFVVVVVGIGILPIIIMEKPLDKNELEKLYFFSGWFYTIIALASFLVILFTAFFAYDNLSEASRTRKLTVLPYL